MKKIIVIVGPTGVGKTKLSIELAEIFNGEIINGDSMQVYKDLNIGTAKITKDEMEGIPHHLLDIKDVNDNYTVYDYQKDGRKALDDILKRDKTPIIVGGTGLYIKALLYDYKFKEEIVKNTYDDFTNEELFNQLIEIDPDTTIHLNNRKRIIRALNYHANDPTNLDSNNGHKLLFDALFIGLTVDRETLYERINNRVDKMINEGLVDEVKELYDKNIRSKAITTGIGYKELYKYFDGEITLDESKDLIKKNSRHYAKRQYTWFNHQMNVTWFNVDFNNFNKTIKDVIEYIKSTN